jgi:hypothetical protein
MLVLLRLAIHDTRACTNVKLLPFSLSYPRRAWQCCDMFHVLLVNRRNVAT